MPDESRAPAGGPIAGGDPRALDELMAQAMAGDADVAARRWAASGAMALTGPADGPADVGPARVALAMDALAADIARTSAAIGARVDVDGAALLGERAAIAGLARRGEVSCGGACHLLPTADGDRIALSLAREDDWELLPALFGLLEVGFQAGDGWAPVADAIVGVRARELVAAAAELGMPASRLGEVAATDPLVELRPGPAGTPRRAPWTVVDLSSLWAGPLCANLLGLAGARVVKVESTRRPDGARFGPPRFFELLHHGHESVALDLASPGGRAALRELLATADVVIEASRPRALAAMAASYDDLLARGWGGVWLSITGHGRQGPAAERVAFGDDAGVAGGLVGAGPESVVFCADAVADPATGVLGAAAVLRAVQEGWTGFLGVALARTAAHLAAGVHGNPPVTLPSGVVAAAPHARLVGR
jgi:crotonobetainyl-CoA:carnitine CoA-transferase CaiB-like acyl-CoA transferase